MKTDPLEPAEDPSDQVPPLRPVVGSSLDPADVEGRDDLIVRMLGLLRDGNNLLLVDPRRMGKTAVLDRLVNEPGDGLLAVKIDYEGATTAEDFLFRTVSALSGHERLWKRVGKAVGTYVEVSAKAGVPGGAVTVKPAQRTRSAVEILDAVLTSVSARLSSKDDLLIIAMDEVPLAISNVTNGANGAAEAAALLQALRRVRKVERSIRWIVTGSIGFHHTIDQVEDGTVALINDLLPVTVGSLDQTAGIRLVQRLAKGVGVELVEDAAGTLVDQCNGFPYIIQAVMAMLDDEGGTESLDDVGAIDAVRRYLDDRDRSRVNDHVINRIDQYYGESSTSAAHVLDLLVAGPTDPTTIEIDQVEAADVGSLVDLLIDDHYLVRSDGTVRWRYHLVARLWATRRNLPFDRTTACP